MSQSYSLPCSCGAANIVQTRHAGGQITCEKCQQVQNVPKLRELRTLEVVQTADGTKSSREWSRFQGSLFVLGMLLLVIAVGSGIYTYTVRKQYDVPQPKIEDFNLPDMDGIQLRASWDLWKQFLESKLIDRPTPYYILYRERVVLMDRWLAFFGVLGGAGAIAMLTSFFVRPRAT